MSSRLLKFNPQEEYSPSSSRMPDPLKDYSMFSAPSPKLTWMAPPSTSGWTPCPSTHHPHHPRLFRPFWRRPGCEQTQIRLPSHLLPDLATLLPPLSLSVIWLNHFAPSLNLVLLTTRWTPGASTLQQLRKCLSTLISGPRTWIMSNFSIPIQLRRTQFSAHLASSLKCSTTSEYIQRHLPLPLPHSPHPKPLLFPLILISLSLRQCWLLWLLVLLWVTVHRRRRRWWNILEHHAT